MNITMTSKNKHILATLIRYGLMILLAIIFAFPIIFMMVSS